MPRVYFEDYIHKFCAHAAGRGAHQYDILHIAKRDDYVRVSRVLLSQHGRGGNMAIMQLNAAVRRRFEKINFHLRPDTDTVFRIRHQKGTEFFLFMFFTGYCDNDKKSGNWPIG